MKYILKNLIMILFLLYKYILLCTVHADQFLDQKSKNSWPPLPSLNNGGQQGMGSGYTLYLNNHGYQSWDHLQYTKDGTSSQFSFLQFEALGKVNLNVSWDG